MKPCTKIFLIFLVISLYGVQILHTIYNQVNWPFCSHNFYYHRSPLVKDLYRFIFEDDKGHFYLVDPRHALPIEGYRCGSILKEVFVKNSNIKKKDFFSKHLLERLNQGGWSGFDERFNPMLPSSGKRFIGFNLEKHWIDTTLFPQNHELVLLKKELIHEYKE